MSDPYQYPAVSPLVPKRARPVKHLSVVWVVLLGALITGGGIFFTLNYYSKAEVIKAVKEDKQAAYRVQRSQDFALVTAESFGGHVSGLALFDGGVVTQKHLDEAMPVYEESSDGMYTFALDLTDTLDDSTPDTVTLVLSAEGLEDVPVEVRFENGTATTRLVP